MRKMNIIDDTLFKKRWRQRRYKRAIGIYNKIGRPFWHAGTVGRYYERHGLTKKAIMQYEMLIEEYEKMKILPLPRGPVELFKLGRWYIRRNPTKAKKYFTLYLRAEAEHSGTGFGIRHKRRAQKLLDRI